VLVSSQPGVEEPIAFVTVTSANALGAIATIETTDKSTNKEVNAVIFIRSDRKTRQYKNDLEISS